MSEQEGFNGVCRAGSSRTVNIVSTQGVCAMVETRTLEQSRRDERLLVDRLIKRQGLSPDEALRTVDDYREGKRVEIDPILMEGLDAI